MNWESKDSKYFDYWNKEGCGVNLPPGEAAPKGTYVVAHRAMPVGKIVSELGRIGDKLGYIIELANGEYSAVFEDQIEVLGFDGWLPDNWRELIAEEEEK